MRYTRQDILNLRDSQLNVVASLAVYAVVWAILQLLLRLFDVNMPVVQLFDEYGNFSLPGILVALLLLVSAFVPHWILLRRAGLTWREASRLIRELREAQSVPAEEDPDWVRRAPRPSVAVVERASEIDEQDSAYWEHRWSEVIKPLSDEEREAQD